MGPISSEQPDDKFDLVAEEGEQPPSQVPKQQHHNVQGVEPQLNQTAQIVSNKIKDDKSSSSTTETISSNNSSEIRDRPPNEDGNGQNIDAVVSKYKRAASFLWLILHAQNCQLSKNNCPYKGCSETKELLHHIESCPCAAVSLRGNNKPNSSAAANSPACQVAGCQDAQKLIIHFRNCREQRARQRLQQHQIKVDRQEKVSSSSQPCLLCAFLERHKPVKVPVVVPATCTFIDASSTKVIPQSHDNDHHIVCSLLEGLRRPNNATSSSLDQQQQARGENGALSQPSPIMNRTPSSQIMPPPPPRPRTNSTGSAPSSFSHHFNNNSTKSNNTSRKALSSFSYDGNSQNHRLTPSKTTKITITGNLRSSPVMGPHRRARTRAKSFDERKILVRFANGPSNSGSGSNGGGMRSSSGSTLSTNSSRIDPTIEFELRRAATEGVGHEGNGRGHDVNVVSDDSMSTDSLPASSSTENKKYHRQRSVSCSMISSSSSSAVDTTSTTTAATSILSLRGHHSTSTTSCDTIMEESALPVPENLPS